MNLEIEKEIKIYGCSSVGRALDLGSSTVTHAK